MSYLRKFYFSYIFLGLTILSFSRAFIGEENGLYLTLIFLFLANFTCFATEYLVIKHFEEKNQVSFRKRSEFYKDKQIRNVYVLFIWSQIVTTLIIFFVFKLVF